MQLEHTLVLLLSALYLSVSAGQIYGQKTVHVVGYGLLSWCVDVGDRIHSALYRAITLPYGRNRFKNVSTGHLSAVVNATVSHKHFSVADNSKWIILIRGRIHFTLK